MPPRLLVDFVLLAALWGSSFLFMRLALPEFGTLGTAAVRVAIAALFLLPVVAWRGQLGVLRRHWRRTFFVGLLNSGIPFALYAFALLSISTGLTSILNATTPMFGALIAWVWLKDRPDAWRILGLVIGFAGVAVLASQKASLTPAASGIAPAWAVLASLAACVCYATAASFTQRFLTGVPAVVTSTGSLLGATLGLLPFALMDLPARLPGMSAWLAVTAAGVLCTSVAYVLYFRILAQAGPSRTLTVPFLVPVFAVFYGTAFLDEVVTPWMVGCGAVIVVGTALACGLIKPRSVAAPSP